jgi:hypothetical protein
MKCTQCQKDATTLVRVYIVDKNFAGGVQKEGSVCKACFAALK